MEYITIRYFIKKALKDFMMFVLYIKDLTIQGLTIDIYYIFHDNYFL